MSPRQQFCEYSYFLLQKKCEFYTMNKYAVKFELYKNDFTFSQKEPAKTASQCYYLRKEGKENYCFRPAQGMEARGGAEKTGANGVSEDFERQRRLEHPLSAPNSFKA